MDKFTKFSTFYRTNGISNSDVNRMSQIHRLSFPSCDQWDESAMIRILSMPNVWTLTAKRLLIEGFLVMQNITEDAEILTFAVMPESRNQGFGNTLLARACALAESLGASDMFLEVTPHRHVAYQMYKNHGFVTQRIRQQYYPDGRDAIVLKKSLHEKRKIIS